MSLREDLIQSAVEFLKDPSISDSPLTKRIEFIESKGLTLDEVQELLKRAQQQQSSSPATTTSSSPQLPVQDYYPNAPPLPERDWKDYFIMATTTVGVGYGIYQIVSRYVLPNIMPPSKDKLEQEKESIDQEFSRVEKLLENLELRQDEFIKENNVKGAKIDETLQSIDNIILKTNEKNLQNEESLKYLKLEIENIKSTMINSLDSQKSTVLQELTSLESELSDLKKILLQSNVSFPETAKSEIELKPEEKLERFKIPPVSNVPTASDILVQNGSSKPAWQTYADEVQKDEQEAAIPEWQRSKSPQEQPQSGIPAWQQAAAAAGAGSSSSVASVNSPVPGLEPSNDEVVEVGSSSSKTAQGIPAWQLRS